MPFRNLAREYSTTTGTSNCVLSGAVPGCNTWDLAGVANGEIVRYGIITYSTTTNRPTPVPISGLTDAVTVAGGRDYSVALVIGDLDTDPPTTPGKPSRVSIRTGSALPQSRATASSCAR